MRKLMLAAAAALALGSVGAAHASTLYYGGDFVGDNGLANEMDIVSNSVTYDNFTVGAGGWHVTGLFTNNLTNLEITVANWEIRSGVSEGNGGALVASGSGTPTVTATGRSAFGYTEYNVDIAVAFDLAPGMYWLSVQPIGSGDGARSFESNTDGTNAVGVHTANLDFFTSGTFGANFSNANGYGSFPTFSSGVEGTAGGAPEPAAWAMMLVGFGGLGAAMRRQRRVALAA